MRVKGKDDAVGIYEPLGLEGSLSADILEELKLWKQALGLYRACDWDHGDRILQNLQGLFPKHLYALYIERIAHYRKSPPPALAGTG